MARPRRLAGFSYVGPGRYFLTICTRDRRRALCDRNIAESVLTSFRRTAREDGFIVLAFCLMPDHAHFLVEGGRPDSDLPRYVRRAKQHSGAAYALVRGKPLWQEGYFERVLRRDEDAQAIARYILWNPVRAGLVATPREYPFLGSDVWSVEELLV